MSINYGPEQLTPDERVTLSVVRARARMDRGDIAPMRLVTWDHNNIRQEQVIPWLVAVNMDTEEATR